MDRIKADICILGAGSGGLSVAAGAAQMGARVVLLEGGEMGGDCLNHGCVPSKALIASAARAHSMAGGFGISPATPEMDFAAAKDHVQNVIAAIAPHDSQERFEQLGVRVVREYGAFTGPREVQAGPHIIRARRFVIATGSAPLVPPVPGLDAVPFDTNETIFERRDRPEHLLVIGGGPIGMEMAQAHLRLGCKVTVIEAATALAKDDPELAAIALEHLRAEGMEIAECAEAAEIRGQKGAIAILAKDGRRFHGTDLLIAAGRRANIGRLNLAAAGIEHDRLIKVDDRLRTTNRRVYAIGDVASTLQFTHVAGYQAGVVIRSALFGLPARSHTDHIPWATYVDPEIAQVGLDEPAARERFGSVLEVVRFPYAENDRAVAMGKTTGLIKVMVVRGRPVGAGIVGSQADVLISVWSLAIANRLKMSAIANMVAPYPTLGEINKRVAGAYFSPRLFDSKGIKRIVRMVQMLVP